MNPSQYRAWLVDLDGTLYDARPVRWAMALELALFGWGSLAIIRAFRRQHEQLRAAPRAGLDSPYQVQLRLAAEQLGLGRARVAEVVEQWMVERPAPWLRRFRRRALLEELREFRATGGKTALVSDYPARRKLDALGARGLFDVLVANGEEGSPPALKPDPAGYLMAATRLEVAPENCLVIGDRDDADGAAARAAGMGFRKID